MKIYNFDLACLMLNAYLLFNPVFNQKNEQCISELEEKPGEHTDTMLPIWFWFTISTDF